MDTAYRQLVFALGVVMAAVGCMAIAVEVFDKSSSRPPAIFALLGVGALMGAVALFSEACGQKGGARR